MRSKPTVKCINCKGASCSNGNPTNCNYCNSANPSRRNSHWSSRCIPRDSLCSSRDYYDRHPPLILTARVAAPSLRMLSGNANKMIQWIYMNHGLLLDLIFNVNYNRLNHHNNNHCSLYNAIHHNNHLSSNASTYNHHSSSRGANPISTMGPQQEDAA